MTAEDRTTLLKIKSLLNDLRYVIKDEDLAVVDEYHEFLRRTQAEFKI